MLAVASSSNKKVRILAFLNSPRRRRVGDHSCSDSRSEAVSAGHGTRSNNTHRREHRTHAEYVRAARDRENLSATGVEIKDVRAKRLFWGSLLPRGAAEEGSAQYVVEINRDLAKLFDRGFTQVDWEQRRRLRRKPLAQWLHLYYSSHAKP